MPSTKHYCIVAGEMSGDNHAAALVAALRHRDPTATFSGVAGPAMRRHGVDAIATTEELSVMGFTDVFWAIPRLITTFRLLRSAILKTQPSAVIMVDYPGFNLRLAASLRRYGYRSPLIHYISPTVWAWGRRRLTTMSATLDLLMVIYPFEKECFKDSSLRVEYVGNPTAEALTIAPREPQWRSSLGIPESSQLLGLFPGSRVAEISRNLPLLLDASRGLGYPIAISAADTTCASAIDAIVNDKGLQAGKDLFIVPRSLAYVDLLDSCRAAIAKSGTVTLELALRRCPTVVTYLLTTLNRFIARYLLRLNLPHYCIVNILAGRELFPELIVEPPTPHTIRSALLPLLVDGEERRRCLLGCEELHQLLATSSAAATAASLVEEIAACSA